MYKGVYSFSPGMYDGKTCFYIQYSDGTEEKLFYDEWNSDLDKKIKDAVNKHFIEQRKEKLNKLNGKQ